jgi:hypothetical protein
MPSSSQPSRVERATPKEKKRRERSYRRRGIIRSIVDIGDPVTVVDNEGPHVEIKRLDPSIELIIIDREDGGQGTRRYTQHNEQEVEEKFRFPGGGSALESPGLY